jgi:hypothetical protein
VVKGSAGALATKANVDRLEQTQWPVLPFINFSEVVNTDHYVGDRTCQIVPITARSVAFIGDENASCAPASLGMEQRHAATQFCTTRSTIEGEGRTPARRCQRHATRN